MDSNSILIIYHKHIPSQTLFLVYTSSNTVIIKNSTMRGVALIKVLLVISSIAIPIIMFYLQNEWIKSRMIFNVIAVISTSIFGNIASTSIYQIIVDDAVFMTTIHAIFLNPFFLITGAYLGIYIIYRLLILTVNEKNPG